MSLLTTKGLDINRTKNILADIKEQVDKNRAAFSNYNIVRMREAVRYLTKEKLEIFVKIPFFLHINAPDYPGFIDSDILAHGISNFEKSGFFKVAMTTNVFPKSIVEYIKVDNPAIMGFYHIGSLGTFTQSLGSDFDYWVIIDKTQFSKERYDLLEKKLDSILKFCREEFDQEVTFFVMDQKEIIENRYAPFEGEETLIAPKVFLKEEFYRTYLMIAGKIPIWSVLPSLHDKQIASDINSDVLIKQIIAMYDDLIDIGQIDTIPMGDVVKGLLWHICKSVEDPVKAVIKATMIFSNVFGIGSHQILLCEKVKKGYSKAGIDDFGVDPYKALFDQIIEFHEEKDTKGINLIKNAIFFRLCGYPNIKMPDKNTPKLKLLEKYIRLWKLNRSQVIKLLSYATWSESEKLLLEKTLIQRLTQMYKLSIQKAGNINTLSDYDKEKKNWTILKNKTSVRLNKSANKIAECSTFLRRKNFIGLTITKKSNMWELMTREESDQKDQKVYSDFLFLGILGWIMENKVYHRNSAVLKVLYDKKIFESFSKPIEPDNIYMAFQPLKPLSDQNYENDASWSKIAVLLIYDSENDHNFISKAEFLISNTWGELFFDSLDFNSQIKQEDRISQITKLISGYSDPMLRFFIYQLSDTHDPNIVYQIKKAYTAYILPDNGMLGLKRKPYLDKL